MVGVIHTLGPIVPQRHVNMQLVCNIHGYVVPCIYTHQSRILFYVLANGNRRVNKTSTRGCRWSHSGLFSNKVYVLWGSFNCYVTQWGEQGREVLHLPGKKSVTKMYGKRSSLA